MSPCSLGDLFHSSVQTSFPDAIMPYDDDPPSQRASRRAFLTAYSRYRHPGLLDAFPGPVDRHVTAVGP